MNLFKKFGKKSDSNEENKTEEIMKERAQLKKKIAQSLKNTGFSASEVNEVIDILNKAEEEIQIKKDSLIGTNINNEHTLEIMDVVFKQIRNIELQAAGEMRNKIAEIQRRKQNKYN